MRTCFDSDGNLGWSRYRPEGIDIMPKIGQQKLGKDNMFTRHIDLKVIGMRLNFVNKLKFGRCDELDVVSINPKHSILNLGYEQVEPSRNDILIKFDLVSKVPILSSDYKYDKKSNPDVPFIKIDNSFFVN